MQGARLEAPGAVDARLGEFWVDNPWQIARQGHNLSAYERKRMFLNFGGHDFLDISFLSGADNDGDGRSVVAADFRNDGRLDLIVRQAGGGSLLLYENDWPRGHYLEVSLRGTRSNRLGLGARLTATAGGRTFVRELYPTNSFRSQAPSRVHFGLGGAGTVDRLTIRWPAGSEQTLDGVAADRHIVVTEGAEGAGALEAVVPGETFRP
jgi:hypothetical protein